MSEALLERPLPARSAPAGDARLQPAIEAAHRYLVSRQAEPGYWKSELVGDSTLESDAVMLMHCLGEVDEDRQRRLLNFVMSQQNPDGGWPIFHAGPSNLNATVKAYFALRLSGRSDDEPPVRRARGLIRELGGIGACNSYTKFYLAMFGQYDWDRLPSMLPEIMLLPRRPRPISLYGISAWTRTIVVPMLILYALRPRVTISFSVRDLILPLDRPEPRSLRDSFWRGCFGLLDRCMRLYNRVPVRRIRRRAIEEARLWMLERLRPAGGLGAIYPPMLNAIVALRALGYAGESPEFSKALREFRDLEVDDGEFIRVQPCFSAIWDTAWAVHALARGGCADSLAAQKGADWLLSKEIFTDGDWCVNNPDARPAAWAFEFDNPFYPDTDDTSAVLMALHFAGRRYDPGFARALDWLLSMQNPDGGWGAFDRNVNLKVLEYLPWADHNALLDPSTADITGRILQLLGHLGLGGESRFVRRAIRFLRKAQEPDGSWFGRWGVNYVHGTWQVLMGLRAIGVDPREGWIQRASGWLRSVQNLDGGWGESCRSYDEPGFKGHGPSTPSQTAWGTMGLLASGAAPSDAAARRGIEFLLRTQRPDGGWDEKGHTGTGFPGVFYLVYTMYRHYFPLLALQAARDGLEARPGAGPEIPAAGPRS